jgi:hypothetical protein
MIIGAGGGIISMLITYPLVAISSRLQVQRNDQTGKDNYKVYKPHRFSNYSMIIRLMCYLVEYT